MNAPGTEPGEDPFGAPLRHLRRMAPPWADQYRTVCGRALAEVASVVSWEDAAALYKRHGQARAAFLFCQTCIAQHRSSADRPSRWEDNPAAVIADYAARVRWRSNEDAALVRAELLALADLVDAHRTEYRDAVARRRVPDALAERRTARRRGPARH